MTNQTLRSLTQSPAERQRLICYHEIGEICIGFQYLLIQAWNERNHFKGKKDELIQLDFAERVREDIAVLSINILALSTVTSIAVEAYNQTVFFCVLLETGLSAKNSKKAV